MGTINALECGKAVTILAQGLITGSAYYITMVEVPARMSLSMPSAIKSWRPCFDRAKNSQMFLSIFSMAGGFAIYYSEYGTEKQCALWPIASSMVTSIIPYTLFGMMPLNYQLLETEKCIEKGDGWIMDNLNKWANLHSVRTVINIGAFGIMLYAGLISGK